MPIELTERLRRANAAFTARYPGESPRRQPVHTVYVGGHAFRAETAREHGEQALAALEAHAPDTPSFARAMEIAGEPLAEIVRARVVDKLRREPVEDLRIDFEDGYGVRSDDEEDRDVVRVADEVATGMRERLLPPFIGIRVKPLNEDLRARSVRTLGLFLSSLLERAETPGLPPNFVVMLAKVTHDEQVSVLAEHLEALEVELGLPRASLAFEIMIEVAQAVLGPDGAPSVGRLVRAGRGRCIAAHFGTYDYTASCGITAAHQAMGHPACDFAKQVMQVGLAGTGTWLSDGATMVLPVGGRDAVHAAWRMHVADAKRSLVQGFYQGWDMHPAQLASRYAAVYSFYLESFERAAARMRAFVSRAASSSEDAGVLDDTATGQALLNFILRGVSCGAVTREEALSSGLTLEELESRSFAKVLAGRRRASVPPGPR